MRAALSPELPGSIGFLLLPGFSMLALFAAIEPLRLVNQLLGHRHYGWRFITRDGCAARSSCGMTVPADARADPQSAGDDPACLIVVAGFDPWPQPDRRLKAWLRALDRRGVMLGAVDTGAFLLAAADLLGSTPVVVHWESAGAFAEMFPDLALSAKPYEIGNRRLLSAGGTTVLDMMIGLIERTHGPGVAAGVAKRLGHAGNAGAVDGQPSGLIERTALADPDVLHAIKTMEDRIESVMSIGEVAAAVPVSKRTLERKFRQFLGKTPSQVYLQCRLEHARRLLRHSDLTIRNIALASGFSSMSYFCRAYKRRFRTTPGSDRRLDYSLVQPETSLGRDHQAVTPPLGRAGGH